MIIEIAFDLVLLPDDSLTPELPLAVIVEVIALQSFHTSLV
jgi:hypothetical protein